MKIPNELKIGTQTVKITQKPLSEIDSDCNGGWARWEQNEIIIASDVPQSRKEYLFFHELLHFINIYFEEKETTFLAEALYQVLRDNNLLKD